MTAISQLVVFRYLPFLATSSFAVSLVIGTSCSAQLSSALGGKEGTKTAGQGARASQSESKPAGSPPTTSAKNFAEESYERGLEMMAEKQYFKAVDAFVYAIGSAKRSGRPQKPAYFMSYCEAVYKNVSAYEPGNWEEVVVVCDEAFDRTNDERATAWRAEIATALGVKAGDEAYEAEKVENYDEAKKWYRLALEIDPKPEYLEGLCRALKPTGSLAAEPRCAK